MESRLAGVTAGNGGDLRGAPRGLPRARPGRGHDLSFPFELTKRGWRAVYVPAAQRRGEDGADDRGRVRPQAPDDVGPLGRDLRWGMLDPARLRPVYALEIVSHRLLRYLTPLLHLVALARQHRPARARRGLLVTLALQLAPARRGRARALRPRRCPFRVAYYYVT